MKDREPALHDALLRLLSADAAKHPLEVAAFELLGEVSTKDDADDASMRVGNRLGPWRKIEDLRRRDKAVAEACKP